MNFTGPVVHAIDQCKVSWRTRKQKWDEENKVQSFERKLLTDLKGKAAEDGAAVAAGESEKDGVTAGIRLRLDVVVEQLGPIVLVHAHVPSYDTSSHQICYKSNWSKMEDACSALGNDKDRLTYGPCF
jgi:hypothetical protein